MIQNSQDQEIYKQCRNKISFRWTERDNIKSIINNNIANIIQFLEQYKIHKDTYFEIQANYYNCCLVITSLNSFDYTKLFDTFNVAYLEINNNVIKNNKFLIMIKDKIIFRQYNTFHQTDDNICERIYDIIIKFGNNYNNLILLGGEMYVFSQILTYKNLLCYSDFQSIVDDTQFNLDTNENIYFVDYDKLNLDYNKNNTCLIANTGKSGMGQNICNNIIKNNIATVIVISCNNKSFERDYNYLSKNYKIIERIKLLYVNIIVLEIVC